MTVSEVGRMAIGFSISVLPHRVTQATSALLNRFSTSNQIYVDNKQI